MDEREAEWVARRFCTGGPVPRVERHPGGHIHDTWFVADGGTDFVLQRLNDRVFPDCVQMMDNVLRVASHVQVKARRAGLPDPERRALGVLRTTEGSLLVYDSEGRPWRALHRVPGASAHEAVQHRDAAEQVGRAFGWFFTAVQDLRGPPLVEPIPDFKDFKRRRDDFEFIVDIDPFGRASSCRQEIEDVRHYHRLVKRLAAALDRRDLPMRVVHNDAKVSNVLLDDRSGEGLCVIDLDTVAPGVVLFDVGDVLRSATLTFREDATNLDGLAVRDDLLSAALSGYLAEAGAVLTNGERELIPLAGPLMAYESAMRFLTDHLAGDAYFRVDRPRHNLERARAQLHVLGALDRASGRVAELVAAG